MTRAQPAWARGTVVKSASRSQVFVVRHVSLRGEGLSLSGFDSRRGISCRVLEKEAAGFVTTVALPAGAKIVFY